MPILPLEFVNFWVALVGVIAGAGAFVYFQWLRPDRTPPPVLSRA